ncbi:hypothetical protein D7Z54_26420 [Salibacterium salarium]|uniref:Uncharacterized protein n=1 Tax=Salibacterium salarium TaxID=284579 RepID=A0A428MW66_9BACI|nr:hypothetical protein [Salibacterium salarium]RSL30377.1 hypothetical protein D7Z54_26420 [Salibacterium salarium]
MKKTFEVTHDHHTILVENTWFNGEKLYIDGQLQDENMGLGLRASLTGQLKNDDGETKHVKVAIGGLFKIHCRIFVDNQLLLPEEV